MALSPVLDLDLVRIVRALAGRARYRYVQPRVACEGGGWVVYSPNCSRQVDPAGGEIAIALFLPQAGAQAACAAAAAGATSPAVGSIPPAPRTNPPGDPAWAVYARHHRRQQWVLQAEGLSLDAAAARVSDDPTGVYWP